MTKLSSPRWIIWVSNREEDKLLDIHSTVETIRVNELDEYVHEVFICDPGSGSYQDILNDPRWGNGNGETLVSKIDLSTQDWTSRERKTLEELEEFRVWKENNKTIPDTEKEIEIRTETQTKEVGILDLHSLHSPTSEQLFRLKLDMFEKDFVQNADREIKAQIRRSADFFTCVELYSTLWKEAGSPTDVPAGNEPA